MAVRASGGHCDSRGQPPAPPRRPSPVLPSRARPAMLGAAGCRPPGPHHAHASAPRHRQPVQPRAPIRELCHHFLIRSVPSLQASVSLTQDVAASDTAIARVSSPAQPQSACPESETLRPSGPTSPAPGLWDGTQEPDRRWDRQGTQVALRGQKTGDDAVCANAEAMQDPRRTAGDRDGDKEGDSGPQMVPGPLGTPGICPVTTNCLSGPSPGFPQTERTW